MRKKKSRQWRVKVYKKGSNLAVEIDIRMSLTLKIFDELINFLTSAGRFISLKVQLPLSLKSSNLNSTLTQLKVVVDRTPNFETRPGPGGPQRFTNSLTSPTHHTLISPTVPSYPQFTNFIIPSFHLLFHHTLSLPTISYPQFTNY